METFWFVAVGLMLAIYVVLDGFVFGAGIIYQFVAKTDVERRLVLNSFGPVWHGNEVYLIAAGGLLFFAFPKVYAAGFSGFYLALIIVLWLFMLRGVSIKVRSHLENHLWRTFWDGVFPLASLLLAIVFGATLGNLIRGVPLDEDGYFFTALWTTWTPGPEPGILDWYTVLMGLVGATILTVHGANYLAVKTEGELWRRACRIADVGSWAVVPLTFLAILAIPFVQPALRLNYQANPMGYLVPVVGASALAAMVYFRQKRRDLPAFWASSLFILALLGSVGWGLYPNLLIASKDPAYSLTAFNSATSAYGLRVGLVWFTIGISLVIIYTVYVYRAFWGKVPAHHLDHGY